MTEEGSINDVAELESQFILRLPPGPAASLRTVVASGVANLKERLSVQLNIPPTQHDPIRTGKVRFEGWILSAKVMDLPSVIESYKTLDGKNFYKTADIAQMLICKEEVDQEPEPENTDEKKPGKDKRYIYPHGVCPPLKNVRKRRFRKTLRKKNVDYPEIEKEVKRLLHSDLEAVHVRYEIEEDEGASARPSGSRPSAGNEDEDDEDNPDGRLGEHDIFGELSSSEDDDGDDDDDLMSRLRRTRPDLTDEDESRMSASGLGRSSGLGTTRDIPDNMSEDASRSRIQADMEDEDMDQEEDNTADDEAAEAMRALGGDDSHRGGSSGTGASGAGQDRELLSLQAQLQALQEQMENKERAMGTVEHEALRRRLEAEINQLREDIDNKQGEIELYLSMCE